MHSKVAPPEVVVNGEDRPDPGKNGAALAVQSPMTAGKGRFSSGGLTVGIVAMAGLVIVGAGVGTYLAVDRMNSQEPGQSYAQIIFLILTNIVMGESWRLR